jgi:hypothetical protein
MEAALDQLIKDVNSLEPPPNSRPEMVQFIAWMKSEMLKHAQAPLGCPEASAFWKTIELALREDKSAGLGARMGSLAI